MILRKIITLCFYTFMYISYASGQEHNSLQTGTGEGIRTTIITPEDFRGLLPADTLPLSNQINYSLTIIRRQPDSARYLLQDALGKSRHLRFDRGIATALSDLGYISTIQGNYNTAISYYRQAQPYAVRSLKNRTSLAMFYSSMSAPYFHLSNFDSVYYYAEKAEQIIKGLRCKTNAEAVDVSSIYNNIAMLWGAVGNFTKSKIYLFKARAVIIPFKNQSKLLQMAEENILSNIGQLYLRDERLDSARYFFDLALEKSPENPLTLTSMAKVKLMEPDTAGAIRLLEEAIRLSAVANDYSNNLSAKATLGMLLYNQKDYIKAENLLQDVIKISRNGGDVDLDNTYHAYHTLSAISAWHKDYAQAYAYEKKSLELLDSMKFKEQMISVYALESQLGTAQRDREVAQKQLLLNKAENKLQVRNQWLLGIFAGTAFFLVLLWSLYRNSKNKQRLQLKELNEIQKDQEINHLRAMIKGEEKERARMAREIHDGIMVQFSTIKMNMKTVPEIYRHISSEDYQATPHYHQLIAQMESATAELRSTAHNLMPDMLLQGGLADAVLYFCTALQRNTGLVIGFQQHGVLGKLDKEFELSVYRIIQELLQNVIKHAAASKVLLQLAQLSDDILTLTLEDNGRGFDVQDSTNGMGLLSIRNRLRVIQGRMDIQSHKDQGTSIYIEFERLSSPL